MPTAPQSTTSSPGSLARSGRSARAFTLIELLIALTIMAVLAAIVIPTVSGLSGRQARQAIDQVEDLLTMYAYRDSMGVQPVALWGRGRFEDARGQDGGVLGLQVLDVDPAYPNEPAVWVPDRFSTLVVLPPNVELVDVRVDGRRQYLEEFLIARQPSQPRPTIEIDLLGEDVATTVILDPKGLTARRLDADGGGSFFRLPYDLDRAGRGREDW